MAEKVPTKITTPTGKVLSFDSSADASEYLGVRPARLDDWRRKHKNRNTYAIKVNYVVTFGEDITNDTINKIEATKERNEIFKALGISPEMAGYSKVKEKQWEG